MGFPIAMDSLQSSVVFQAGILGILNHFIFRYYEPSPAKAPLAAIILLLEPLALWFILRTSFSWTGLALAYLSFSMTLVTSIVLYRLSPFHPLAKVPGPTRMKISKAYLLWISTRGDRYQVLKTLHEKYGPVLRTAPNEISVIDVDSIPQVLGPSGIPKGKAYVVRQSNQSMPQSIVVASSPALHAKKRRLWNQGMNMQAIRDYEPAIVLRANQLCDELVNLAKEKGSVDLVEWINYFTFDFMSDMAFGGGSEMLKAKEDADGFWDILEGHARLTDVLAQIPWISHFAYKCYNFRLAQLGARWATERIKRGASSKDLWYHLTSEAQSETNKAPLSPLEIVSEGVVAILGGSDTTSSVLACLFWLLLANPEYYKRVQEEVDTVYPPGSDCMDIKKHGELIWLGTCLNEALRLFPPTPTNGPREVPAGSGGKVIAGYFLPEGTEVLVPPYVIHRNAAYFSNPDSFIPERWFQESNAHKLSADHTHNNSAYIPFGYGPRNCVGRALARQEMLMVASLLIRELEFGFAEGFDWEEWPGRLKDYWVTVRGELRVDVKVRGRGN
ncbi:hypothetical protein VKT23_012992 [Stygiomarasmius scandens]|uniref:Cytochrome P450 n=1 Tax=Marasmiellus scandens TaxID=2682957 RepID=A0ABR1J4N3_9AGAR